MPRPHFPVRGGAHQHPRSGAKILNAGGECQACKEKNAELDRLRQELSLLRQGSGGTASTFAGPGILWAALGLCGIGLLFALAAILRHG